MNHSNYTNIICEAKWSFVSSGILFMESCIATIFASMGVFLNVICTACLLMYCRAFPDVIRLQIMSISISYTIRAFYLIYKSIYGIIYSIGSHIEATERMYCVIDVFVYIVTHQVNQLSLLWLGLDRLYVSCRGKSMVSGLSNRAILGNILAIWMSSTIFYLFCVFYGTASFHQQACFCVAPVAVPISLVYSFMTFSMIFVQMCNCAIYVFLIFWSRRRLDQFDQPITQNLDNRFTLWSNFTAGKWLLLVSIFHSIVNSSIMIGAIVNNVYNKKASFVVFLDTYYFIYLVFALDHLIHPILCVRYSDIFKSGVITLINSINIEVFSSVIRKFFNIKENQGTCESVTQVMSVSGGINTKSTIFQPRQRAVVEHHLDPENQNELLTSMWSNSKVLNRKPK